MSPARFLTTIGLAAFSLAAIVWTIGIGPRDAHLVFALVGVCAYGLALWRDKDATTAPPRRIPALPLIATLSALFAVAWGLNYACRFLSFSMSDFDTGIYSNVAFNTATGHPFYSSVLQCNHLGEHFSPVMALFAPLYALSPGVCWILGAQVLAYAAVPFLLHRLCRDKVSDAVMVLLALLWFLYAPMAAAMGVSFHPSTLAAPFILLAFLHLERKQWARMYVTLAFLLLFKENMALVWIGFGLYLAFHHRNYRHGIALAVAGAVIGVLIVNVVMPLFREGEWGHLARLAPWTDLPRKLEYLARIFAPLLLLPLVRWRAGVIALPAVALNLATSFEPQYSAAHHYDDVAAPLLFAAMTVIVSQLPREKLGTARWKVGLLILVAIVAWLARPSPLRLARAMVPGPEHVRLASELDRLSRDFPEDLFYIQDSLGPHLNRYRQTHFPLKLRDCGEGSFEPGSFLVFSPLADPWGVPNLDDCLKSLADNPEKFQGLEGYDGLAVFRVR